MPKGTPCRTQHIRHGVTVEKEKTGVGGLKPRFRSRDQSLETGENVSRRGDNENERIQNSEEEKKIVENVKM